MGELLRAGSVAGSLGVATFVLRALTQMIIVLWSIRTDEAGRKHALALLRVLSRSALRGVGARGS
jgi:hypothetical protein